MEERRDKELNSDQLNEAAESQAPEEITEQRVENPIENPEAESDNSTDMPTAESEQEETPEANSQKEEVVVAGDAENLSAKESVVATEEEESEEEALERGEQEPEEAEDKRPDYSVMELQELLQRLKVEAAKTPVREVRQEVDNLRAAFQRRLKQERQKERTVWVSQGGDLDAFSPIERPEEQELRATLTAFQTNCQEYAQAQEETRQNNLKRKQEILQAIEALIAGEEVLGTTFQQFNELQRQWREVGPVPRAENEHLYQSYALVRQKFYDYVKINQELRDLDYRKNFEAKIKLCEQAEDLLTASDEEIFEAFRKLQELHRQWKELGPVMPEKSDEIWERFSAATAQINQRHRDRIQQRKSDFAENLQKKRVILAEAEALLGKERKQWRDWSTDAEAMMGLQKSFRAVGPVARAHSSVWEEFHSVCNDFFTRRREFERDLRQQTREAIQRKVELCLQAEALQESTDWRATTDELIALQKLWKDSGYVPRKKGDELWKRFRAAQDHFFNRRAEANSMQKESFVENLKQKEAIIAEIEAYEGAGDMQALVEKLKEFQNRWSEIGFVPYKQKDAIHRRYRAAIDKHYEAIRLMRGNRPDYAYSSRDHHQTLAGGPAQPKGALSQERQQLQRKMAALEAEKVQLENNIGFFSTTDENNPLVKQVRDQITKLETDIAKAKEEISALNTRLRREKEEKKAQEREGTAQKEGRDDSSAATPEKETEE